MKDRQTTDANGKNNMSPSPFGFEAGGGGGGGGGDINMCIYSL